MLPEIDDKFAELKQKCGADSLDRVEAMMYAKPTERDLLQADAKWVMPGLSNGGWLDKNQFEDLRPVVAALESNSAQIKREIHDMMNNQPDKMQPYDHYIVSNNDWQAYYLVKDGKQTADNGEVPTTRRILNNELKDWICPLLEMHFSVLAPGVTIPAHCDLWNFSINLHLAVDIPTGGPDDCAIKVAGETRQWTQGECLLFDYSYEHEVWNKTDKTRVCLLMDVWHPEITLVEREALTFFITEIRQYM